MDSVFGSERLTGALFDRLTHHVHILEMNGESFRSATAASAKRARRQARGLDWKRLSAAGNRLPLRYSRFTPDMDASVKLRREMEMELRIAITRGELSVAYQPVVDTGTGAIQGFEALLRWNHPERGEIRPDLFVLIAEQGGLMIPLGTWVLRHVFTQCRDWPDCYISVNLSPLQIMAGDFLPMLAALLEETGMDPQRLVFEVTEGVMLDRSAHVIRVLQELNSMGIRVALDDFGIGYSSLSYLHSFQFDRIKIDRSFVQNIERDRDAHSILCAITRLGKTLRTKVVAEGVEPEVQRLLVQAAGRGLRTGAGPSVLGCAAGARRPGAPGIVGSLRLAAPGFVKARAAQSVRAWRAAGR